jgi:hypothetical protein
MALMTAARMTAFSPGASPPPVQMAIRRVELIMGHTLGKKVGKW